MDRRTQKTRTAIMDAFSTLLQKKSFSKITIQEIIDTANVGRSTFYAHFPAKEDLLRDICTELFEHISSWSPPPTSAEGFFQEGEYVEGMLAHILTHLARNGKVIKGILASEGGSLFVVYFKEYLNRLMDKSLLARRLPPDSTVDLAFLKNHISGSFVEAVRWWFQNGTKPEPRELARQYWDLIFPALEKVMGESS